MKFVLDSKRSPSGKLLGGFVPEVRTAQQVHAVDLGISPPYMGTEPFSVFVRRSAIRLVLKLVHCANNAMIFVLETTSRTL